MVHEDLRQLVSSTIFRRTVLGVAREAGVDVEGLLARLDVDAGRLANPDAWLPARLVEEALERIGEQTGHPAPGIWLGERASPESGDVLGYAMRTAPTLGEAYRTAARYYGLVGTGVEVYYHERDGRGMFTHAVPPELATGRRHRDELIMATMLTLGRGITGVAWTPVGTTFQHPAPADLAAHHALFGRDIRFGGPVTELAIGEEDAARPCLLADDVLHEILDRYAGTLLPEDPDHPPLVAALRQTILKALPAGDLSIAGAARQLHLSARTLQRRLNELGTSHSEILRQTRQYLAEEYLRSTELSIDEISFLLGYANTPAFTRAFRSWTGSPPSAFRRSASGARG